MPASRESSVGPIARRGAQQRAHRPYNADDLNYGKRTGIRIDHDGGSDDIQPFDELIGRLDAQPPPKVPIRNKWRKSINRATTPTFEDEYGEQSMEMAESEYICIYMDTIGDPDLRLLAPDAYFKSTRQPIAPNSISRVGSSSRPVARISDVDFDTVPSPRPSSLSHARRQSRPNGRSELSRSYVPGDDNDYQEPIHTSFIASKPRPSFASVGLHGNESARLSNRRSFTTGGRRSSVADSPEVGRRTSDFPSHFSTRSSYVPQPGDFDDDSDNEPLIDPVPGGGYEPEYEPQPMPRAATPGRPSTSFTQLDEEDEDEETAYTTSHRLSAQVKGKGRIADLEPSVAGDDMPSMGGGLDEPMLEIEDMEPFDDVPPTEPDSQEEQPSRTMSDAKRKKKRKSDEARADDKPEGDGINKETNSQSKKAKKAKTLKEKTNKSQSQPKRVRATTKPVSSSSQKENLPKEVRVPVHSGWLDPLSEV
jgi:hypothetical protein